MVKFHFLDVGPGDCTIVHFPSRSRGDINIPERIMMVDLHHNENSSEYEHVIGYYKENFKYANGYIKPIFRYVCTHPHHDHIRGINQLFNDNQIEIYNFWDLDHDFRPEDFDGSDTHEDDWNTYDKIRDRSHRSPVTIVTHRGDPPRDYWNEQGDRINVISPSKELIYLAHYNEDGTKKDPIEIDEMAYALIIRINDTKVLLAGDGKERTWNDIYENCKNDITNCKVLKAGHHGQKSGLHEDAVKLINPAHIIFSNSYKEDISNGAETYYQKVLPSAEIHKTSKKGTIIVKCHFNGTIEVE